MTLSAPPSGKQFTIRLGGQPAVVTEVGGGLRSYVVDGVEVFTGDSLPEPGRRRRGPGVEPMTAAPDAVSNGDGLVTLLSGRTHVACWELRPGGL